MALAMPLRSRNIEWPTLLLAGLIYGGWGALAFWHAALPTWFVMAAGAWLVAWHGSLQHEVLHGHPTRWRRFNLVLGSIPIAFWMPYASYRISHLVHHRDERLTDPLDDPESFYWDDGAWQALGPLGRLLVHLQTTLLGRMAIGPAWTVGRYWLAEWRSVRGGDQTVARIWAWHALHLVPVVVWLVFVCHMDLAFYCFGIIYPATSLLLIRSFAEHRAAKGVFERTAIVENAWILGPLFLFNNLHAAHHELPNLPWYRLPAWYRRNRERLIRENGGLVYNTYFDVARRFLLKPHDRPKHPFTGSARRPPEASAAVIPKVA